MVERLTEWDEYGNADIIALSDMMPEIYAELSFSETNDLTDVLNHLAAYEDTGLSPEEITDLRRAWDMYGGEDGITAAFQKAAERDAAVEELRGICWCCAHGRNLEPFSGLTTCEHMRESGALARGGGKCKCPHWEWRGPQREDATP